MKAGWVACIIFGLSLTFFTVFNAEIPITDPVESNYALPGKEMLLGGDWLTPHIYGHFWFDKPVMIYWLIAISYQLFGVNEFAARFPAALFSAGSVLFLYWFACKLYGNKKTAIISAIVLGTSLQYWILARMVITDAILFFFMNIALASYYLGLKGQGMRWYIVAYVMAGFAVLTKGPIGIVLPAMVVIGYILVTRQWYLFKQLFVLRGMAITLCIAAPWYVTMFQLHGMEFINTFFGLHNYIRATISEHPKDNYFYYYLVLFPASMLPWSGMLVKMLVNIKKELRADSSQFLLTWLMTVIVFFTLMATKYPTYVFPAVFPAALLIGRNISEMLQLSRRVEWLYLSLPGILFLGIAAGGIKFLPLIQDWSTITFCAFWGVAAILWFQIKSNYRHLLQVMAVIAIVISLALIDKGMIPLAMERSTKNLALKLPKEEAVLGLYGEYAASAVFYSGYPAPLLTKDAENHAVEESWSGKYTMPKESVLSFLNRTNNQETYVLVLSHQPQEFLEQTSDMQFMEIASRNHATLYKRLSR